MLVSTRGFKRASLELGPGGLRAQRTSYVTCVTALVSTHGFKNELYHLRSVLVSAHCFKNEYVFCVFIACLF